MADEKAIADKQAMLALKKQIVCTDSTLKDFNWVLNMPLDQNQVAKSNNAVLDHSNAKETTVIQKDVKAPLIEFTFDLQRDQQKADQIDQSCKVNFTKV